MISILMPVKNAGRFLIPCIESILKQDFEDWELLAVNDGSTDNSGEILNKYASEDKRIFCYRNNGNGIIDALRMAYEHSSGELIHRMDADDLMPIDKLSSMLNAAEPGSVITGKVEYFSDDWLVGLGFQNYRDWINGLVDSGEQWKDIFKECPIPSPAWMISRDDLDRIGAFNSDLIPEDYDLCFRMYQHNLKIIGLDKVVHKWRDSQNRTSRKDPNYFPMAYYPLKLHYFMQIERDHSKPLVLWGAGKKGKRIALWLLEKGHEFTWISNNKKKHGIEIHGVLIHSRKGVDIENKQVILAMASPEDQTKVQEQLDKDQLIPAHDYYWFC